jgi:hypothetical protein
MGAGGIDKMRRVVIFGASSTGRHILAHVKDKTAVAYFSDNDSRKWGNAIDGILIKPIYEIPETDYDEIIIAALSGAESIYEQLTGEYGIPYSKINRILIQTAVEARGIFLESFSKYVYLSRIAGAICECGVFRGEFAKEMNRLFPDRRYYLFDTFSGFDGRDTHFEKINGYSNSSAGFMSDTTVESVLAKLPHPEMCVINSGYFPDTFNCAEERFCFVNLDMDLYMPTEAALKIFYPRMVVGGIILIHDYFNDVYSGVRAAVEKFLAREREVLCPIGDWFSVAIVKRQASYSPGKGSA